MYAIRSYYAQLTDQQTSIENVYSAGDNNGIGGVYAAKFGGKKAANQILQKLKLPVSTQEIRHIERKLAHLKIFAYGLTQAFPFPKHWAEEVSDDTVICRCENVTVADIRKAVSERNCHEINQLKAHTRTGMGRCQGRVCGTAVRELLAYETGKASHQVGRIRAQSPLKPIPITMKPEFSDENHSI